MNRFPVQQVDRTLRVGYRVDTPLGPGVVSSVRMEAPSFSTPIAAHVVLDKRRDDPNYSATVFPVSALAWICAACSEPLHADWLCPAAIETPNDADEPYWTP